MLLDILLLFLQEQLAPIVGYELVSYQSNLRA